MQKKLTKLFLSLACAGVVFSSLAAMTSKAESGVASLAPVLFYGTITKEQNQSFTMIQQNGDAAGNDVIIHTTEETRILDAVTGYPVGWDDILDNSTAYAYVGPAMTLSLPPQTTAELVFVNVPADFKAPEYVITESLVLNQDGISGTVTGTNGKIYTVPSGCQVLPYLTRNIVTLGELTPGRGFMIWTQSASDTAYKVVIFPGASGAEQNGETVKPHGWLQMEGLWYYFQNGTLCKGWLQDGKDWYYLDPDTGIMQTGFLTLDGKTYYLQENGKMLTSSKVFIPDENGALH